MRRVVLIAAILSAAALLAFGVLAALGWPLDQVANGFLRGLGWGMAE